MGEKRPKRVHKSPVLGKDDATSQKSAGKIGESTLQKPIWSRICSRCRDLKIPEHWAEAKPLTRYNSLLDVGKEAENIFLQRLLFDVSIPLDEHCDLCMDLRRTLINSYTALSFGESADRQSWFQLDRGWGGVYQHSKFGTEIPFGILKSVGHELVPQWKSSDEYRPPGPSNTPYNPREVSPHQPDYDLLRTWLHSCANDHNLCKPLYSTELHSIFLINVDTHELVPYPNEEFCDYIALSYVWGGAHSCQFVLGRLPSRMHATIDDAIAVVKNLGKRYLWVDSVCINQADSAHKIEQIRIMDTIYSGAFATIIALDGKNANAGLPRVSTESPGVAQSRVNFGDNYLLSTMPPLDYLWDDATWKKRAWTFQEDILSRRRLFFTSHQVYFDCNEMRRCESMESGREPETKYIDPYKQPFVDSIDLGLLHWIERYKRFEMMLCKYINRELSHETDALDAISGLLRRLERGLFPTGFYYGMPMENFRLALSWYRMDHVFDIDPPGYVRRKQRRRPSFPSWSWAGWRMQGNLSIGKEIGLREPPLRVWTHDGRCLSINDLEYLKETGTTELTANLNAVLDSLYSEATVAETQLSPSQIGKSDEGTLVVQGIILTVEFFIDTLWRKPAGGIKVRFSGDQIGWDGQAWMNEDLQQFESNQAGEFLLLRVRHGAFGLEATLLLLEWHDCIASRRGLIYAYIDYPHAETLLSTRSRFETFKLG